jgi:hypothetical protein
LNLRDCGACSERSEESFGDDIDPIPSPFSNKSTEFASAMPCNRFAPRNDRRNDFLRDHQYLYRKEIVYPFSPAKAKREAA